MFYTCIYCSVSGDPGNFPHFLRFHGHRRCIYLHKCKVCHTTEKKVHYCFFCKKTVCDTCEQHDHIIYYNDFESVTRYLPTIDPIECSTCSEQDCNNWCVFCERPFCKQCLQSLKCNDCEKRLLINLNLNKA